jgi:hypothetical protein
MAAGHDARIRSVTFSQRRMPNSSPLNSHSLILFANTTKALGPWLAFIALTSVSIVASSSLSKAHPRAHAIIVALIVMLEKFSFCLYASFWGAATINCTIAHRSPALARSCQRPGHRRSVRARSGARARLKACSRHNRRTHEGGSGRALPRCKGSCRSVGSFEEIQSVPKMNGGWNLIGFFLERICARAVWAVGASALAGRHERELNNTEFEFEYCLP